MLQLLKRPLDPRGILSVAPAAAGPGPFAPPLPGAFAAYAEQGGEPGREALLVPMIAWLKEVAGR
jgi:hypothetical protein